MSRVGVTRTSSNALLPVRAHGAALGYDVFTLYHTTLPSGGSAALTTGLVFERRDDRIAFVLGRLPTEEHERLEVLQDFVEMGSEVRLLVRNHGTLEAEIDPYTAMSRIVLLKQSGGAPNVVEALDETERGESGYGSTGLK